MTDKVEAIAIYMPFTKTYFTTKEPTENDILSTLGFNRNCLVNFKGVELYFAVMLQSILNQQN